MGFGTICAPYRIFVCHLCKSSLQSFSFRCKVRGRLELCCGSRRARAPLRASPPRARSPARARSSNPSRPPLLRTLPRKTPAITRRASLCRRGRRRRSRRSWPRTAEATTTAGQSGSGRRALTWSASFRSTRSTATSALSIWSSTARRTSTRAAARRRCAAASRRRTAAAVDRRRMTATARSARRAGGGRRRRSARRAAPQRLQQRGSRRAPPLRLLPR